MQATWIKLDLYVSHIVSVYVGCFRFTEWLGYIFERNRHTFDWWCVTKPAVCWRQVFSQFRVVWCWYWENCYCGAGTYEWAGNNSYCITTPLCLTSLTRPPYWYPEPPGKQRRDVREILWESLDLGDCMPLHKRMLDTKQHVVLRKKISRLIIDADSEYFGIHRWSSLGFEGPYIQWKGALFTR